MSYTWAATCLFLMYLSWGLCDVPLVHRFEFAQPHMGTMFRIALYAPDAPSASRASNAAFDRVAELDHIMSDYRPSSELIELCRRAGGPPMKVSEDLFRVMTAAQDLARRSEGAFDITVGPVVRLWRRARRRHELPDPERLARALELVGYEGLRLDREAQTAQLMKPGMLLDLGGIAKGYAADEALRVLKRYGIQSALVAGGGDIAVGSSPPSTEGWRIAIARLETPNDGKTGSEIQNQKSKIENQKFKTENRETRFVYLHNAGISTSGDAEQHLEIGGARYSHIINPKTGMALTGPSSVTVIAPDDTTADGLATAVSVLGPERGIELVKATPGAAALIVRLGERGIESFESKFPSDAAALTPSTGILERNVVNLEKVRFLFPRLGYDEAVKVLHENGSEIKCGGDFGGTDEPSILTY